MKGKNRYINTNLWNDPWVSDLTVSEKLLFVYLLTNPLTNIAGIYEVSIKRICYDTGLEKERVLEALKGFESYKKVIYLNRDNYVIMVNFLKHQKLNDNMKKGIVSIIEAFPVRVKEFLDIDSQSFESLLEALNNINLNLNPNLNCNMDSFGA